MERLGFDSGERLVFFLLFSKKNLVFTFFLYFLQFFLSFLAFFNFQEILDLISLLILNSNKFFTKIHKIPAISATFYKSNQNFPLSMKQLKENEKVFFIPNISSTNLLQNIFLSFPAFLHIFLYCCFNWCGNLINRNKDTFLLLFRLLKWFSNFFVAFLVWWKGKVF